MSCEDDGLDVAALVAVQSPRLIGRLVFHGHYSSPGPTIRSILRCSSRTSWWKGRRG